MATTIDKAVAWAAAIATDESHGYDQGKRWGPDYDCSSLLISAWEAAGVPVKSVYGATRTSNMYSPFIKAGFQDVSSLVNRKTGAGTVKGDIWLTPSGHTEMMFDSKNMVGAHSNELKQTHGGQVGDQTGGEINISPWHNYSKGWRYVLRYPGGSSGIVADKSSVTSANRWLNKAEMEANATYIAAVLLSAGWSMNAIAGVLGNMQSESGINPGMWEGRQEGNPKKGLGLTQWTPASKLIDWANENGYKSYTDIDCQLDRLKLEFTSNLQYYPTEEFPMKRGEFPTSTKSPYELACVFARNYERSWTILYGTDSAKQAVYKQRGERAEQWYTFLQGRDFSPSVTIARRRMSRLLFLAIATD